MLLLATMFLVVAVALIAVRRQVERPRLNQIIRSASATAPVATALLVFRSSTDIGAWEIVLTFLGVLLLVFVLCVIAVAVIGVPLSLLLDKLGLTSRLAYVLAGVAASLMVVGGALIYDWCCIRSGPFMVPLLERVSILGIRTVTEQYLRWGLSAALCATVAANFYWTGIARRVA